MAASSAALKTAYQTEVDKITDTLQNAKADYLLDRFIEALDNQNALEANEITSYSIAGRTVTNANPNVGAQAVRILQSDLESLIYGTVHLSDFNTGIAEPGGGTFRT
jgi:hypothetical protein